MKTFAYVLLSISLPIALLINYKYCEAADATYRGRRFFLACFLLFRPLTGSYKAKAQRLPTGDFQGLLHRLTLSGHSANLA